MKGFEGWPLSFLVQPTNTHQKVVSMSLTHSIDPRHSGACP